MPYLIDGHNLIPKIPGLTLQAVDDEIQLIELLQEFCRRKAKTVEVYFDNSPPGQPRLRNFGRVVAHFVRPEMTADDAIRTRLQRLRGSARNWTVVSSDLAVQAAARAARARLMSSEAFASLLGRGGGRQDQDREERPEISQDPEEIGHWLHVFGEGDDENKRPGNSDKTTPKF